MIRQGRDEDVPALTGLAVTTYIAAFGHSFTPEDLAAHLAHNLAPANIARFIAEDVVLVAELVTGGRRPDGRLCPVWHGRPRVCAREQPRPGTAPPVRPWRVSESGHRYAADEGCIDTPADCRPRRPSTSMCGSTTTAPSASARHGFEVVGTRQFEVESGSETSLDLIMVRSHPLTPAPASRPTPARDS